MTSAQFNADLFAMANNVEYESRTGYKVYMTETVNFDATTNKATLTYAPVANGEIYWNGKTDSDTATVTDNEVTVTGLTGDVEITYQHAVDAKVAEITNTNAAIGEAFLRWPVYGAADDCSDSAIKGYVEMHIYRCRVSQMPGFDTSYKSAATNAVTFGAMDAKKADGEAYSIAYFELAKA